MVGENDITGLGEALQDAGECLAVHAEFTGDGIGAGSEHSFVVGDGEEVGKHLSVALENSLGCVSCSHNDGFWLQKYVTSQECDMSF